MSNTQTLNLPLPLEKWIKEHKGNPSQIIEGRAPEGKKTRDFVIVNCPLMSLKFEDHRFNPRQPNAGKINELIASISTLSLLTPLTCAYLDSSDDKGWVGYREDVVLLDGRHRFRALEKLKELYPEWAETTTIDLKIYFNLAKSDIFMLATYLNKTRKALAKGEYYKFIVEIYESKLTEIVQATGKEPTEKEVFKEINARELSNKNFDLSIGRIVGMTAFDDEQEGSWFPYVGLKQQDKIKDGVHAGYFCPITAGNLATLLGHLCSAFPYDDDGSNRATEIANVLTLGVAFQEIVFTPVYSYDEATGTTVSCKHWPLEAFGQLIEKDWAKELVVNGINEESLLSHTDVDWKKFKELLRTYFTIMTEQADVINKFRRLSKESQNAEAAAMVQRAWSYQTQTDQIRPRLKSLVEEKLLWLKG